MTPAEHVARAEALLDGWDTPESVTEAAMLAMAHVVVALVRHEALWEDTRA